MPEGWSVDWKDVKMRKRLQVCFPPSPVYEAEEGQPPRDDDDTPPGPAHWLEEIQGLLRNQMMNPKVMMEIQKILMEEVPGPDLPGPQRYVPEYLVRRTANGARYHTDRGAALWRIHGGCLGVIVVPTLCMDHGCTKIWTSLLDFYRCSGAS